jgi:hypothetical protein
MIKVRLRKEIKKLKEEIDRREKLILDNAWLKEENKLYKEAAEHALYHWNKWMEYAQDGDYEVPNENDWYLYSSIKRLVDKND